MKKINLCVLLVFALFLNTYANLEVFFTYAKFNSPQGQYIETYMSTIGSSTILAANDNGKFQSQLEILMTFKQADSIVNFEKYILKSPEVADTLGAIPNFIDVQRINLANGKYLFEMSIKDINSTKPPYCFGDTIDINFGNELSFSDIEIIESYSKSNKENTITKNGYELVPYVGNFFPENMSSLKFYIEAYNSDKSLNDEFVLKYFVSNYSTNKEIALCSRFKKYKPASVLPFIGELNIEKLQSGNYYLNVQIINRSNEIVASTKYFFQRANTLDNSDYAARAEQFDLQNTFSGDMLSADSLIYYIKSMRPIADVYEQPFIDNSLRKNDLKSLQNYFVSFWLKRNFDNPEEEWYKYRQQIALVEREFKTTIRHGFETDRGIVYLKYGPPNSIVEHVSSPQTYPYEVWDYYRIGVENNCTFIFYNESMLGENYELLHSSKLDEIKTFNWESYLYRKKTTSYGNQGATY